MIIITTTKTWRCLLLFAASSLLVINQVQADTNQKNTTGSGMPNIYICQAEDKTFLGEYVPGESEIDGVATFENEEGKAIWRHQGFWYMGDLSVGWPPETTYRCIEGCKYQEELPPINGFSSRKRDSPSPPTLQFEPCGHQEQQQSNEEL